MNDIFSSPGMIATAAFVFVVQGISLLLLLLNMHLFRTQKTRYASFLRSLGNEAAFGNPGTFLIPVYFTMTLISTAVILYLFVFQPHLI